MSTSSVERGITSIESLGPSAAREGLVVAVRTQEPRALRDAHSRTAEPAAVQVPADVGHRHRLPAVPSRPRRARQQVGGLQALHRFLQRSLLLSPDAEHPAARRVHACLCLSRTDRAGAAAQRAAQRRLQARHPDHLLHALLHLDRGGHRLAAGVHQSQRRHRERRHRLFGRRAHPLLPAPALVSVHSTSSPGSGLRSGFPPSSTWRRLRTSIRSSTSRR